MRYLTVGEILELYSRVMEQSGGGVGIRDLGGLESAVTQPRMTFNGKELYPTIFIDGNKRIGHAAMETFLMLNGHEISASIDEQEEVILGVASGMVDRHTFTNWLKDHNVEIL
jgi:death on curing protein